MTRRTRHLASAAALLAIAAATLTLAPAHSRASARQDGVTITFLANEGVIAPTPALRSSPRGR